MKDPDLDLIERSRKGDEAAFRELVRNHMERAVQVAYNSVSHYEDARDIAQEAFVKVYRSLQRFDGRSKFTTWFYRILVNTAKDFHRKKKWKNFLSWGNTEEKDRFIENIEDPNAQPEQGAIRQELREKMQTAILALPEKQQFIFKLRYLENLSLKEIEEMTGLSSGTVKATLHFAGQKFKKHMALQCQGPGGHYEF